jgi:histidine phosphotransferase ChpT
MSIGRITPRLSFLKFRRALAWRVANVKFAALVYQAHVVIRSPAQSVRKALQERLKMSASSAAEIGSRPALPDQLELAALLCSRVCHDLISPVGAIVNGLEVLDDAKNSDDREFALNLIRKSAKTASAKLQFCRLAFGAAGSAGAQIDTGDAETMARGFLEDDRTKLTWNLPRTLQPKNRVKLLLNMLILAQQAIPRGGMLTVDATGEGEKAGIKVRAGGLNARVPQNLADLLAGNHQGAIDAHAVQPHYTRLLAQACGLRAAMAANAEAVEVTAV